MAALAHQIRVDGRGRGRPHLAASVRTDSPAQAEAGVVREIGASVSAHPQWASAEPVSAERHRQLRDCDLRALPPRCVAMARHLAGGFQEKEIAALFGVGRTVVARERDRFERATGAVTRRDIVLVCRQHGLDPV